MNKTVIASAVRTPVASFQGSLSPLKSTEFGGMVIREAIERAGIDSEKIDEVIMGCVLPAGLGQAPARQAAISAGLSDKISAFTINKVCSSGLRAVTLADQMIRSGDANIAVAGGMESMTNAPYLLPKARSGLRLGDGKIVDGMVFDGLWDIYSNQHMGNCAELCAAKYSYSREMQDAFAEESYRRAQAAIESGAFKEEILPVSVPQRKGEARIFDTDEEPGRVDFAKMKSLKPSFKKDGTVTAANASSISDGAAAMVVVSEAAAKDFGLKPMAGIISHATYSHEPEWFTTAPIGAMRLALSRAGLEAKDIDLWEINEAFSPVTMAAIQEFSLDGKRVNISGGAVAIGHPIGASGARILVTLLYGMRRTGARTGLATLCNGGGEATAIVVESA
ncbi:MAG TPA: thiolase family protein [bacterium]|nr:thiolase family protein [bacterium]